MAGPISWTSRKKTIIALSTKEAEYITTAHEMLEHLTSFHTHEIYHWHILFTNKCRNSSRNAKLGKRWEVRIAKVV